MDDIVQLADVSGTIFNSDDIGMEGQFCYYLSVQIDTGELRDIIEKDAYL